MDHQALRERVLAANLEINRVQLAILTWGNASEIDREAGCFAIKPSGVDYDDMTADQIPLISIETGEQVAGTLRPSSDTATHWRLYHAFPTIGGIVHTHSPCATAWAQAHRAIPCMGTTHADTFHGPIPCTRPLTQAEIEGAYERNTGDVIAEHFSQNHLNATELPGVLVSSHGPFAWGKNAMDAVTNGRILEEVARMATTTLAINPATPPVDDFLLEKHFLRKHGAKAYYGQK